MLRDEPAVHGSTKVVVYVDPRLCCQKILPHVVAPRPYRNETDFHGHHTSNCRSGQRNAWNLTAREQEILQNLTTGLSNKKIAHELGLDPSYLNSALSKIYRKMKVRTRTQALLKFFAVGF